MKTIMVIGALLGVTSFTYNVLAQEEGVSHKGFQFRQTLGWSYLKDNEVEQGAAPSSIYGDALATELYLGGSISNGVFIGATGGLTILSNPNVSVDDRQVSVVPGSYAHLFTVGPYLDYYPIQDFHILVSAGIANYKVGTPTLSFAGTGYEAGAGLGWDFFSRHNWSMGFIWKMTYSNVDITNPNVGPRVSNENIITPAFLFSVSYH